ncbi:MAG: hypothetical protein J1E95_01550 [Muribaculaceae bacterium]|nr:hypothetical protein [Muribaculaceae bacterium]
MGFFKEFAKGFGQGYLEQRGIEGTIEDLGSLAKGVKNFFSSDDQQNAQFDQEIWDNMQNNVFQLLDEGNYNDAENEVINYYNNYENGNPDFFYYRLRTLISLTYFENLSYDSDQEASIREEVESFLKEMKNSQQNNDMMQDYQSYRKQFEEAKRYKKEFKIYMNRWDNLLEIIKTSCEECNFDNALIALEDHYKNYEDSKDYSYYSKKFDILLDKWMANNLPLEERLPLLMELKREFETSINFMKKLGSENNAEDIEGYEDAYRMLKEEIVDAKCLVLTINENFDEAKDYLNNNFTNKNGDYYRILCRIESLRLENAVQRQLPKSEVEKYLINAEKQLNLAIQMQEEEESKKAMKNIVTPRINMGKQYVNSSNYEEVSLQASNSLTEQEYKNELKACLEDGVITERERRLLDKLRKSLGISEQRAQELEAECNPNVLTKEEEEYAEEVRAVLEDGIISEKERRLLNRLAKSLNISEERAKEIENLIQS